MSPELPPVGRALMLLGAALFVVGAAIVVLPKVPPGSGRLPGDIFIQRDSFTFYLPLTTCLILSGLLSLILWIGSRLR